MTERAELTAELAAELIQYMKESVLIRTYTTKEVATILHFEATDKVDLLRKLGAIKGIKKGNGFVFTDEEVRQFLRDYNGLDISNKEAIKASVYIVQSRKHGA